MSTSIKPLQLKHIIPVIRICNQSFLELARYPEIASMAVNGVADQPEWQFGAFNGKKLVGFLVGKGNEESKFADIRLIGVAPASGGKGIGRRLVKAIEDKAKQTGYNKVKVGTPFAQKFYERCGFKVTKEHLKMMKEIIQKPIICPKNTKTHLIDFSDAETVLTELPKTEQALFLEVYLAHYRCNNDLFIHAIEKKKTTGIALGRIHPDNNDFAEIVYAYSENASKLKKTIQSFEYEISKKGLRYIGITSKKTDQKTLKAMGYARADMDIFLAMVTLEKEV